MVVVYSIEVYRKRVTLCISIKAFPGRWSRKTTTSCLNEISRDNEIYAEAMLL